MEAAIANNDPTLFAEEFLKYWTSTLEAQVVAIVDDFQATKAKEFLTKSITVITSKITEQRKKPIALDDIDCGELFMEIDDLHMVEPRGRFQAKFFSDRIVLTGKQGSVMLMGNNVSHLCLVPSTLSSKKEGEDFLAIVLSSPTAFAGKETNKLIANLSRATNKLVTNKAGESNIESIAIPEAFHRACGAAIEKPSARLFCSSMQQKPYVNCHKGTQEGAIYPLQSGIIFVKPLLFLDVDHIASITAGRGGGSGNTRYVDLKVSSTLRSFTASNQVINMIGGDC
jgi:hypothetical protein